MKKFTQFLEKISKDNLKFANYHIHHTFGTYVNAFVMAISISIADKYIGLIICALIALFIEVAQKISGGKNTVSQMLGGFFSTFVTSLLWFAMMPHLFD
jgi:hypothetical protein